MRDEPKNAIHLFVCSFVGSIDSISVIHSSVRPSIHPSLMSQIVVRRVETSERDIRC